MSMQIKSIILFNHRGSPRPINFTLGTVNIITGSSDTGKSSIIRIVEYCLGNTDFNIPQGNIRTDVEWYGVLLNIRQTYVFIAKTKPDQGKTRQNHTYLMVTENPEIPSYHQLHLNRTDSDIRTTLSRLLRTGDGFSNAEYQNQELLRTSLDYTKYYLFQESSVIANPDILFHRQQEQGVPQDIKETIPYFLGLLNDEDLVRQRELDVAQSGLRSIRSRIRQMESVKESQRRVQDELIKEAQEVGLITSMDIVLDDTFTNTLLSQEFSWQPPASPTAEDERILQIQREIDEIRIQARSVQEAITSAELHMRASEGYSNEINEQLLRLESIEVFEKPDDMFSNICPLCNNQLPQPIASASDIRTAFQKLESDLQLVKQERPALQEYISRLTSLREELRGRITNLSASVSQILQEQERTREAFQQAVNAGALANRVIGKIAQYKATAVSDREIDLLKEQEISAQDLVDELRNNINIEDSETERDRVTNLLGQQMTEWAERLNLNPSGRYRLDLKRLMVYVDSDERSIPMNQIGGGKNVLGCHLVSLLALHRVFILRNRPVPNFIILDQPAQGFFPSKRGYETWDGKQGNSDENNADLVSARQMFEFLFEVCQSLEGQLQIIVLEHANFEDKKFQDALAEEPWTSDSGLLPSTWKSRTSQVEQLDLFKEGS